MSTSPIFASKDEVIDLERVVASDGSTIWKPPVAASSTREVIVRPGGTLTLGDSEAPLSRLPEDRMATEGHWDRIVRAMQTAEAGQTPAEEIIVQPGGTLVPVRRGTAGAQLSKLPEDRMAASSATAADLAEAQLLDPGNFEGWSFVSDPTIPGLRFHMRPVVRRFIFFTFRSPSHGGRWFLSPLDPSFDHAYGHQAHMMRLSIGGEPVPIVCGNQRDGSFRDLAGVRGAAAKFATYHDLGQSGRVPFSA